MLRSLFSGVTGLQAHQIAMDVESNNIANVNTIGYKYSRANFSDLLAQTNQIATAPQGELGGKNAVQIGLGSSVNSITRIDNNGFIVQGWVRDEETGKVDATAPITNINIPPGLTIPANASTEVTLKANLNSGETVKTYNATHPMKTYSLAGYLANNATDVAIRNANTAAAEDMAVMFNDQGRSLVMQPGQGIWVSYKDASITRTIGATSGDFSFNLNGTIIAGTTTGPNATDNASQIAQAINNNTAKTGVVATVLGDTLTLINDNSRESDLAETKNISITASTGEVLKQTGFNTSEAADPNATTAYNYRYATNATDITATDAANTTFTFRTTEQLRLIMETHARKVTGANGITITINDRG
ncbi:MAG: flagellar hook protein FlgE, partial [Thiotrichales bacterium]|nr:flagellar hook protein FlgE [Thiotrichales bacterium]